MTLPISPLSETMARLGLTTADLAAVADCHSVSVSRMRAGEPISRRVMDALEDLGCDVNELLREHNAFRAEAAKSIKARVLTRVVAGVYTK